MRAVILAIGLAFLALGAQAADLPLYKPVPAWVKPIPIPDKPASDEGVLLQVSQARFSDAGDEIYDERAIRIQDTGDLARYGNVVLTWSPETETLVIHKLELIRGGQVIDQLDGGKKVQVLHRETNLEMAMFDGALTATVQLEGLQVGDVIHLATTRQIHDPVLKGHSQLWSGLARPGKIGRVYLSADWPAAKPLRWKETEGLAEPRTTTSKEDDGLVVDLTDAEAPLSPRGAPARFGAPANVQMSDFASWSEVSALMAPLFDKASTLEAGSPLKAEIAKIKAQSNDPKVQAFAALKLVQDQIRYLFIGLNNGNLIPAAADETWRRRFGDCKAKTALLLALLHGLGIQAQPALVDTQTGDALPGRLPSLSTFDHVAVKATIGGKTYWLDGTRLGDLSLDSLETPNFHWMLPVQASGAQLEALKATVFTEAHYSARLNLDASAGLDVPAKAHAEHQWRGDGAQTVRLKLQSMSATERDRTMRGYWQQAEPWINATTVSMKDEGRSLTLVMDGSATMSWGADNRGRTFVVTESSIGGDVNFQRQPGPNADAPFAVNFPSFNEGQIKVILPNNGLGFQLINAAPIDQVVAGAQYKRTARMENGTVVIDVQVRAMTPEFPYAEATAAASTLRTWGMHAVMIASNPGLADVQAKARICENTAAPDEAIKACQALVPQISSLGGDLAAVYFAMGRAYAAKGDGSGALDNFSKAVTVRPDYALALAARGLLLTDRKDFAGALADLDHALAIDNKNPAFWGWRGFVYLSKTDYDRAIEDLNTAITMAPNDAQFHVNRGNAYRGKQDDVHALADFNQAITLDPKNAQAYVSRGRLLFSQKAFELADQDFSKAIDITPKAAPNWAARGLARTALKQFPQALADFEQALKLDPNNAAVYRARAETYAAMGAGDKAAADRQTALALQPRPVERLASQTAQGVGQVAPPPPLPIPPLAALTSAQQVQSLLASGRTHADRKEFSLAIVDFDQALTVVPRHPDVLTERGKAYAALEKWDQAAADFDQVLKMRPNDAQVSAARAAALAHGAKLATVSIASVDKGKPSGSDAQKAQALLDQAKALLAQRNYDGAIADLSDALKLAPRSPQLLKARADAYRTANRVDAALADYDGLVALDPNDLASLTALAELHVRKAEWRQAIDAYDRAIKIDGGSTAAFLGRGRAYFGLPDDASAIADYSEAIKRDSNNADAYYERGRSYARTKDREHALRDFNDAIRLRANFPAAFNERGRLHADLTQYDLALADYNQALVLRPDDPTILGNRGYAYGAQKQWDKAIADYDAALRVRPDSPIVLNNRGFAYQSQSQPDKAQADYEQALRLNPDYVIARANRAGILINKGAYAEAVADYDTLLRKDDSNPDYHYRRGFALMQMGDADNAAKDFDQTLKMKPDNAYALTMRGAVHVLHKELDQAAQDCDAALKISPRLAMGFYVKGVVEHRQGKTAQGDDDLAQARALQPIVDSWFKPSGVTP